MHLSGLSLVQQAVIIDNVVAYQVQIDPIRPKWVRAPMLGNLVPCVKPLVDVGLYLLHGHFFWWYVFLHGLLPSGGDGANQLVHAGNKTLGSSVALTPPELQMGAPAICNRGVGQLAGNPPLGAEGHVHLILPHQVEDDGARAGIMPTPIKLHGIILEHTALPDDAKGLLHLLLGPLVAFFTIRPSKKNAPTGRSRYSSKYALSDRLYCGECGTRYQRCTWRNRDGSKRIVWRCVSRVDYGSKYCHDSPTLDEEPLHRAILAAINSAVKDKDNIVYNLKSAMEKELAPAAGQQLSLSEIDSQLEQLNTEFSKVLAEASESGNQAAYSDRFREIMQKQTALKAQRDEIQQMLAESGKATAHIEQCRQAAETTPSAITEWDEALIRQVVESVTAETGSEIIVALKSGASIHQELL